MKCKSDLCCVSPDRCQSTNVCHMPSFSIGWPPRQPEVVPPKIISAEEAREKGLTHYFTGEPCINGHIARRYVKSWACVECQDLRQKARRA